MCSTHTLYGTRIPKRGLPIALLATKGLEDPALLFGQGSSLGVVPGFRVEGLGPDGKIFGS